MTLPILEAAASLFRGAGYVPFAIMGTQAGTFGYEMEIIVPADSPIKTPADLVAAAKAKPGALNYGTAGVGSGTGEGKES